MLSTAQSLLASLLVTKHKTAINMKQVLPLQQQLQLLGPLTAAAWESILENVSEKPFEANRPIPLPPNGVIYVKEGLLKQYVRTGRVHPSINRFIAVGKHLFIPFNAEPIYVKTILKSTLWYWTEESIRTLLRQYPELYIIDRKLRDSYERLLDIRLQILESSGPSKMVVFQENLPGIRPYIKAKDLANYFSIHPNYLSQL
jgi:CRP-like cAMP-binding protein